MVTPEGKKFFEACVVLLENFEKAKTEAAEKAEEAKRKAAQEKAEGLQRVGSLLGEFDSDCPAVYRAYEQKEDGKGGVILTNKTTGQKVHIQSPSRGVYCKPRLRPAVPSDPEGVSGNKNLSPRAARRWCRSLLAARRSKGRAAASPSWRWVR